MAVVKMAWADCRRWIPRANMIAMVSPAAPAIHSVKVSSCAVSGVFSVGVDFSIPEMFPTSVSAPVPVTIITPLPCVTGEFMNAMFDWSPSTGFWSVMTSALFDAGTLSPVRPGLVDLQGGGLDDPPVGADIVTRREQHDVADDHLVGRRS